MAHMGHVEERAAQDADRRDIHEAKEALRGFVIAGCNAADVLQLIEAPLDQVPHRIQRIIAPGARLSHLSFEGDRAFPAQC